jgi:hypothetical protein|tara:strand:- start:1594 stop:1857 length:264 start_codon:yes stop_codon:yes gene_type:complete
MSENLHSNQLFLSFFGAFYQRGLKSAPVTEAPHRAAAKAITPVPQATSKTILLALVSANFTSRGAAVSLKFSNEAKSDHTDLAFCSL